MGTPTGLSGHILESLFIKADASVSKKLIADIVFDDETELYEFGIDGKAVHTPGHTSGSVSLFLSG
jgi:glyoxylase-like metal-dependent hydrolase (beta-lactamase superfamily II)